VGKVRSIDYWWRLVGTGLSFSLFGLGGIMLSLTLFPLVHLFSSSRTAANHRCQYLVHLSFRALILWMRLLRVLTYEIAGAEKLKDGGNRLIVANHPSLIDVVFIIALLPRTFCVVKQAAWSNPFMAGVMWATGYIPNANPVRFVEACVDCLAQGENLVVFPESTRTVPGQPLKLRRGAANIIVRSRHPFVPVTITSRPRTLSKTEKWYQIPTCRAHFKVTVGDSVDPAPALVEGEAPGLASRRMNRLLRNILTVGIELHANHH
jgi:1-acyl-sn-glycerol-3-phosphate acyltransferase